MKKQILLLFVTLLPLTVFAQKNLKDNIALQGYDPVAYFENNMAVKGEPTISANFEGAVYNFSTEKNKALFLKNPTQYEPQFGGYCAYGMSEGYKAPIKPEAFTIVDNKLYLNYNLEVKEMWLKKQKERIQKAELNWGKLNKR